jgi:hypothetical protein
MPAESEPKLEIGPKNWDELLKLIKGDSLEEVFNELLVSSGAETVKLQQQWSTGTLAQLREVTIKYKKAKEEGDEMKKTTWDRSFAALVHSQD